MKPTIRLLSMLAAMLMLLAACSTAEEAGETTAAPSETQAAVEEEPTEEMTSEAAEAADAGDTAAAGDTIVAVAAENPELSQLVDALQAAGLTTVLEEAGPLTVFAPNDEAFAKLNQDDLAQLLTNPTELGDILQFHVVEGAVMSSDLADGDTVTTLQGGELTVSIDGDTVMVGDATVVQADLQAGNGVIHVIDTVLIP